MQTECSAESSAFGRVNFLRDFVIPRSIGCDRAGHFTPYPMVLNPGPAQRAWASPSFLFATGCLRSDSPGRIAIALELLELVRRAQQVDRSGACVVADGEWCAVLAAVASRVSQWQRVRSRWRAQWGSGWPERLPVPRPLTAPPLPKA